MIATWRRRTSTIKNSISKALGIQGVPKVQSLFFSDAGGQGCAAGRYGVPGLWGRGGGSRTGLDLQRAVLFLARAVVRSRNCGLESKPACAPFLGTFGLIPPCTLSGFLLHVV